MADVSLQLYKACLTPLRNEKTTVSQICGKAEASSLINAIFYKSMQNKSNGRLNRSKYRPQGHTHINVSSTAFPKYMHIQTEAVQEFRRWSSLSDSP